MSEELKNKIISFNKYISNQTEDEIMQVYWEDIKQCIEKQQAEIEQFKRLCNKNAETAKKLQAELEKKDNIINLMAKKMAFEGTGKKLFSCDFRIETGECDENGCECCIKKYYEKKVEE